MTQSPDHDGWSQSPDKGGGGVWAYVGGGLVAMLVVPFAPLILAGIEQALFGTSLVEDFCRTTGIHGVLDDFYEATLGWLLR